MSVSQSSPPPWWRLVLALALAPVVPAVAFSSVSPFYAGVTDTLERILRTFCVVLVVGGYAPTLLIGLPVYAVLRRRVRATLLACMSLGACVAALPWLLVTLLPTAQSASFDGRATVIEHHPTPFGLWVGLKLVLEIGLLGALGGASFWLAAAWRVPPRQRHLR